MNQEKYLISKSTLWCIPISEKELFKGSIPEDVVKIDEDTFIKTVAVKNFKGTIKWRGDTPCFNFYTELEIKENERIISRAQLLSQLLMEADAKIRTLSEYKDTDLLNDEGLAEYKAWVIYRKKLRNMDHTLDVAFPDKPSYTQD